MMTLKKVPLNEISEHCDFTKKNILQKVRHGEFQRSAYLLQNGFYREITMFTSRFSHFDDFFTNVINTTPALLKEAKETEIA